MPQPFDLDRQLLQLLQCNGGLDRDELSRRTGVPRSTIYDHLVKMLMVGTLTKRYVHVESRGRPRTIWSINGYIRKTKTPNTHMSVKNDTEE